MKHVVRMATRRSAILDKILTNIHSLYNPPKVLPPSSFSDHNVVVYEPAKSYRYNAGKSININTRLSGPKAKEKFSTALASFDWTPLYLQPSCGQKFEFFQNSMTCLIDLHLPKRCVRRHTSDKPWVTDYFRQLIRQRQRAFLCGNFVLYRRLRNKVIRTAKSILSSNYLEQLSSLHYCDPGRWCKHTKALTGLGKTSSNLHATANSLCGGDLSTLAGKVNSFSESVSRYLVPLDAGMVPLDCPVPMHYIVNSETVSKLLSEINVNKAIGPDDIPS